MPLIRYPGSKAKLVKAIVRQFPVEMSDGGLFMPRTAWEYREPFFGSGAIGFEVLRNLPDRCGAWINDRDQGIYDLWRSVKDVPGQLCDEIKKFTPSAPAFYLFKKHDQDPMRKVGPVTRGFEKLALHLMSYSGLGAMAGGPLGGKNQDNSKYSADCRWSPEYRIKEIWELHYLMKRRNVRITGGDFSDLLKNARNAFVYCDPPYVEKGPELYKHSFNDADHARLAKAMLACDAKGWAVSYDDHPTVHALYQGRRVVPIDVRYSIAEESDTRRKNREILITHEPERTAVAV